MFKNALLRNGKMSGSGVVSVQGSKKMIVGTFKRNNLQKGSIII